MYMYISSYMYMYIYVLLVHKAYTLGISITAAIDVL